MLKSMLIIFFFYILYIYYNIYIIIIVRKNLNVICDLWFVVFYFPCVYAWKPLKYVVVNNVKQVQRKVNCHGEG